MLFLVNYQAGQKKAYRLFVKEVLPKLRDKRIPFSLQISYSRQQSLIIAKEAVRRGEDIIVACGGDGTLNSILGPLIGSKTKLAILPFGSANDFAFASLGISRSPHQALYSLLSKKPQLVDLGQIKTRDEKRRYFLNVFGIGIDAAISESLRLSEFLYRFPIKEVRYGFPLLHKLITYPAIRTSVWVNDKLVFEGKALFLTIFNGKREGAYFWLNPKSQINDGRLEVIVIEDTPFYYRFSYLVKIMMRRINLPKIRKFQGSKIQIELGQNSKSPIPAQADGELFYCDGLKINVSVLKRALQIIA